ncbi:hypothetical protein [Streptomyces sp. NRRL S-350]|uniref:hypothetical protein n=1 Tax=Streptomyces sp. NRRL S-350 TaxID=1463902 RepID=UPI0004BF5DD0|nr:hypothetical protein [Streptomyces sp. NRRL S-350]
MPVSRATEAKLRAAMARLLEGRAERTNGALTKENLAREAGVSHATVHRADTVLADWHARVDRPLLRTPGEMRRDEEITELRRQLRESKQNVTLLQNKLDALATVTANLYHENQALRNERARRTGRTLSAVPKPG